MFITFYGINNIGKSTQAQRIIKRLREMGKDTEYLKYPIYDIEPSGKFLNSVLRSHEEQKISEEELQIWFVLNRYQFQKELGQMLSKGKIVVAEDYRFSGIAWGTTKGANQSWLESINSRLIPEDLVILLHGERQMRAKEAKHIHESRDDLVEKCQDVYLELAEKYGWDKVKIQDKPDDTTEMIWEIIKEKL